VIVAAIALALVVAACGSAATKKQATTGSSSSTSISTAGGAGGSSATVKTVKGSLGVYLVGQSGRALYLWVADSKNKSHCSGACAAVWPPVTASGAPTGAGQAHSNLLGTITRPGGHKQVTYDGHPLYYYAGDSHAGTTAGQGNDGFGAKWWLVSPKGSAITG
jgi:predicted lipoprotein with Yx(FWY)xxD motif